MSITGTQFNTSPTATFGSDRPYPAPSRKPISLRNFSGSSTCVAVLRSPEDDAAWQRLFAKPSARGITVRGAGASYSDSALNHGGTVGLTTGKSAISGFDTDRGIVNVDAGVTLAELLARCVPRGWTLPVLPGTAAATAGGAFAADVHGKNHSRAGSFSSHVTALVLATPGRGLLTVGPDAEPDVFWATAGGLGLTGAILRLRMQLEPISTDWMTTTEAACGDLDELLAVFTAQDRRHEHVVAWIDGHATARSMGRGIVSTADHTDLVDLPPRLRGRELGYHPRQMRYPATATANLVRPVLIRVANAARYAHAKRAAGTHLSDFPHVFHPLDAVANWPALYGRRGLVQYQFSIPSGQEQVLRAALHMLPAAACPPALVVLKRFGAGSLGHLSFPSPGWTLALDLPAVAASLAERVLERLDHLVATAGGRVYLVKDSRMHADLVADMYPKVDQWRAIRDRLDPAGILTSGLDRRLDLTGHHGGERSW